MDAWLPHSQRYHPPAGECSALVEGDEQPRESERERVRHGKRQQEAKVKEQHLRRKWKSREQWEEQRQAPSK